MDPHAAGRTARSLEPLHALSYFAPEVEAEITGLGVRRGMGAYFASRAAAMGRVGPGPVAATFFVFNPSLVAHLVPAVWDAADPADVVAARYRGVSAAYQRLLGEETLASAEVAEAADLARTAAEGCTVAGRPLYAAHADLAWPERAAPRALPRAHPAPRAPRRRARRRPGGRRAERDRGPGQPHRHRQGLHPARRPGHAAAGPTRSGTPPSPPSPTAD